MAMYVVLILLAMACLPPALSAQAPASLEVSGGYSFVRDPRLDLDFPGGWTVGAAGKVNAWLSAVADVSGSRRTVSTLIGDLRFGLDALMLGTRASTRIGPFVEFGQILAGAVHSSGSAFGTTTSVTHFGWQVGGGLDYALKGKLSVRGEIDVRWSLGESGADSGRALRGVAGVVYRLF
jgi:opacity protein-like surface antigen